MLIVEYDAGRAGFYRVVMCERGAPVESGSVLGELVLSPAVVFGAGFFAWRDGEVDVEVGRWAELRLTHALPRDARGDDVRLTSLAGPGALAAEVEPLGASALAPGGYAVRMMVSVSGVYRVQIVVLGHPIDGSPFTIVAHALREDAVGARAGKGASRVRRALKERAARRASPALVVGVRPTAVPALRAARPASAPRAR